MSTTSKQYFFKFIVLVLCLTLSSCLAVDVVAGTAKLAGKIAVGTVKTTGKAVYYTAKATNQGVKYLAGSRRVKLEREGNSFYVQAIINRKHKVRLLLDTGATSIQLPMSVAIAAGLHLGKTRKVDVSIADGSIVEARAFYLKEISVSGAKVKNVQAIVVKGPAKIGLLGMSFLDKFIFKMDTDKGYLYLKKKQ